MGMMGNGNRGRSHDGSGAGPDVADRSANDAANDGNPREEASSFEALIDRPSGQRISGVYATAQSPKAQTPPAQIPQRPVRLAFHLRIGLTPPETPPYVRLVDAVEGRPHAIILDGAGDPEVLERVLRPASTERGDAPTALYPSIVLGGTLPDPALMRMATQAGVIIATDFPLYDSLHFSTEQAVRLGKSFARRDPSSRYDWARLELGPWIVATVYPKAKLTPREGLVLALHALGFNRGDTGELLRLSDETIKSHISRLLHKTSHSEMPTATASIRKALGPLSPDDPAGDREERVTTPPRISLDKRTPPGGRRI